MKNSILTHALKVSMESEQSTDAAIDQLASDQLAESNAPQEQLLDDIAQVDGDLDVLDVVEKSIEGDNVSLENLAHARGMVDGIGFRYGALHEHVSMESVDDMRLDKTAIMADVNSYRTGLENHAMVSMEGLFLTGRSVKNIGKDLDTMKKTIGALKSTDVEKIREIRFSTLKHFLKIGGGLPQDIPRAIREVSNGLDLSLKHANDVLTSAQRAAEIAVKTNWTDEADADKARGQIKGLKLDLAKITTDLNGYPMFGNRSFGIKVKGSAGELGDWDKKYSFGSGQPNMGKLKTALIIIGSIGLITMHPIVGGALLLTAIIPGESDRDIPLKAFAAALEEYAKSAEKIYSQRTSLVTKSTQHGKLMSDLKNVKGLPRDVRKAIIRASGFGWSISNGVYSVVEHSVHALSSASVVAAYA